MSFPRYPAYKPSGVEWLGEVPEHWGAIEARREITFLTSGSRGWAEYYSDEGPIFLRIGNLTRDSIRLNLEDIQRVTPPAGVEGDRTEVNEGDVLFSITAYLGSVAVVPGGLERAYVSQHVCLARLANGNLMPDWLAYSVLSASGKAYLEAESYGGTKVQLALDDVKSFPLSLPPIEEQRSLATFLDRETAKIDALIAEQQRLIELLQEKRQAVISHAVTKGLNPDAPMKDSGVEWLGEVPEHWEVGALGYALSAIGDVDHYMPPTVAEGVPYVMTGDLEDLASEIDFTACKQISRNEYHQLCKKIITSKGDLIVARYATIGTVSYVDLDLEFIVSYSCVTIRPKAEKAFGRFLFFCLKSDSFFQGIRERINTNTQGNVGIADLKLVKVALPPIEKQLEITEFLQTRTEEMGRVIQSSEAVIDLLQERRSALISAAVTGQIDVRGLVPEAVAA
jgi:type I restriction enzyme S subunit